jgi:hypothetical protein
MLFTLFCVPAAAAARYLMWVLEDIGEMNAMGVERMVRSLALLQVRTSSIYFIDFILYIMSCGVVLFV